MNASAFRDTLYMGTSDAFQVFKNIASDQISRNARTSDHTIFYYADAKQSALEIGTSLFFFLHGSRK